MKKNVDQITADLYNATKAAYLREFSGLIRNNAKGQPVTVDMMFQIANGRSVDGLALADGTDTKKVIELMPDYSCSLASLPRIYKQVARLAGETCEKITVGGAVLNAYGLTDKQLNAKENKKILSVLKKNCPAPKKNDSRAPWPCQMGLYHDSRRRCAVWTDSRVLIVAPWLYNEAAAGHIVAADGTKITDFEGQPAKYPDWSRAVPDMSYKTAKEKKFEVYSVPAAAVAANAANVAAMVKGVKKAKKHFIAARYASGGGVIAFAHTFAPWFSLVDGDLYFRHAYTAAVGYIHTAAANGFIIFMPMMVEDGEINQYADNKTIYADTENDIYIKNQLPQAAADSLPLPFLACCPEVEKVEETTAADADTQAPAEVEKVEKEETPAAAPCVALVPVAVAAEVEKEETPTPAEDAAVLVDAAAIRCYYSSMAASCQPLPPVDAYEVETLADNTAIIRCRRRDAAVLVAVSGPRNYSYSVIDINSGKTVTAFAYNTAQYTQAEAMAAAIHSAIKHIDTLPVVDGYDTQADTAADTLPDPPAVVTVSAPYPPAPRHHRRRISLRPVRRWFKAAAVLVPVLIILGLLTAASGSHAAADDAAAEVVAQVVELQAVTVTAEAPQALIEEKPQALIEERPQALIEDEPPAPSPVKKLAAPSPVKNVAEAAECSSQKTDAADSPAGEKTASPMATASDSHGLTICEGTPWAYTMMNWA